MNDVRTRILFAPLAASSTIPTPRERVSQDQEFWAALRSTGATSRISRLTRISRATQNQREPISITIDPMAERDHHFAVSAGGGKVIDLSQVTRGGIYDPVSFITGYPNKSVYAAEQSRGRKLSEVLFGRPGAEKAMYALRHNGVTV